LMFLMLLCKRTELAMLHFIGSILQVSYFLISWEAVTLSYLRCIQDEIQHVLTILIEVTLNKFNGHTHTAILDSKDKLRFHLVRRLKMGTNSYISILALSIIARYPRF
jgi:hypothetical protein